MTAPARLKEVEEMLESDRRNSQDAAIQPLAENAEADHRIAELEAELSRIRASRAWQVAMKIQKMLAAPAHAALFIGRNLKLCALQDLEPGTRAGRRTEWTITGRDPQFAFSLAGAGGFPAAHYRLVVDAPAGGELLDAARIYVDEGSGFSEERTVYPKWRRTRGGTRLVADFTLPRGAVALRFDPCEEPGRIVLGRFRLRRLSRAEYYSGLALRLSRERAKRGQGVARDQRRVLDVMRAKGLGGLAAKLRALDPGAGAQATADIARKRGLRVVADNTGARFVAKRRSSPPQSLSARLICFYLPQFHPVPQNDEWWGEGFTEWTNVRPAVPQFEGHYQPHVPGELGYYDLRDQKVLRAQVDLAKLYGIGGFCFYFYWFGGERLLETPVESYLAQPDLDLPFCLCWANENWTRRWDGLEREILIAQDHSPQDDIAFILHVAKYLRDPRYIRVDGKPLLLVYRPMLLPDAQETAARWRAWCRDNGVGEIYLAYTQSFETVDPARYGFDAAVEFPPNNSGPPDITEAVTPLRDDFSGKVFDWSVFVERSAKMPDPGYTLFRGGCPSWDNTARRKNRGTVFVNNTPEGFRAWLRNAIADTQKRFAEPDKRLVFINAWNEWAEGAHLEPDQAYGYAWLDAARQAVEAKAGAAHAGGEPKAAVVVHAYYADVFREILEHVEGLDPRHKLFVSTTAENAAEVRALIEATGREFDLIVVKNRGRDVLPFLRVFPKVRAEGFEYLVKVHTKKSQHRQDGDVWRRDMYAKLLDPEAFERALDVLATRPDIGMIGPEGHFVSMTTYLGSNEGRMLEIGRRLGLDWTQIIDAGFFAGTMFVSRVESLDPLMGLGFDADEFEPEEGQIDGTLAHALERAFAMSVMSCGQSLVSTACLENDAEINDRYGFA